MVEPNAPGSPSAKVAEPSTSPAAVDQRRAVQAAVMLALLAVASFAGWLLIPRPHLELLDMFRAIVATQIVGAVAVMMWLALWRPPSRR